MGSFNEFSCLQDLLRQRAGESHDEPAGRISFYPLGDTTSPTNITYSELYGEAKLLSSYLEDLFMVENSSPVIIHLDDHHDTILYFWAVLLSGGVPVISSPQSLSDIDEQRVQHLKHLADLFESPIVITREDLVHQFDCINGRDLGQSSSTSTLRIYTMKSIQAMDTDLPLWESDKPSDKSRPLSSKGNTTQGSSPDGLACLMLTSGSTGNAKAVCLTHSQILAAVRGKSMVRNLISESGKAGTFLNWIGLDHVASLIEIHIQALHLNADQVHVHTADIVSSPETFVELCSRHGVARTFAPNFFLASLVSSLKEEKNQQDRGWDLSKLSMIACGGEANDVETCRAACEILSRYGAKMEDNVIVPGFGMTETCAGAIFNTDCPGYDISRGYKLASVGRCMPGVEMRITSLSGSGRLAAPKEIGNLEVRGEVVFHGYYRNPVATAEAFTADGWFKTGDRGFIDQRGNLCLAGRLKAVVNVNGVKIVTADLQAAVERAISDSPDLKPLVTRVVCFAARPKQAPTEQLVVAYMTRYWPIEGSAMANIRGLVCWACALVNASCGRPLVFAIGKKSKILIPMSTLGKISGAKIRSLFESGAFDEDINLSKQTVEAWKQERIRQKTEASEDSVSDTHALLRLDIVQTVDLEVRRVGLDTSLFDLGFSSMDIIRLKHAIDKRMHISLPVIDIMKNPTVRSLALVLDTRSTHSRSQYDPIVTLKSTGSKPPLWLIHPGVGEVLVFVGLAKHMPDDRPIHALRARGFEPGQPKFTSITEAVEIYVQAIRRLQPSGPYILAGYSYGTMLAFEIAKRLEGVRFLGSFNLPPHIKTRMRQLSWNMCLLHLAQFLGLVSEARVADETSSPTYLDSAKEDALLRVMELSDKVRLLELGLGQEALTRWADVAYGLQSMAVDYEPSGVVDSIDVFHAEPLRVAASSREEWVNEHLSRWAEFCRTTPHFHAVGGAHYTMLGPEHVEMFARTLQEALLARGV
ncbi:hypothetical protein V8F20_011129 [Naviculisporaceae sp. PSN 640]